MGFICFFGGRWVCIRAPRAIHIFLTWGNCIFYLTGGSRYKIQDLARILRHSSRCIGAASKLLIMLKSIKPLLQRSRLHLKRTMKSTKKIGI